MNQVTLQLRQPQSTHLVNATPNVYSNANINPTNDIRITRPSYNDHGINELFFGLIQFLKQLEQDKINVFPKPSIQFPYPSMNPSCTWFIKWIPYLGYFPDLFNNFETNPYLQVFQKFSVENSRLISSPQVKDSNTWENLFYRQRAELYSAKARLQAQKFQVKVQQLTNEQKTVFRRVMQTHEQANCIFLELSLLPQTDTPYLRTQEEAEKSAIKMMKEYFKWLHRANVLTEKLCDIQWRIVKGLDNKLLAQAFIYILGDESDYLPFLKEQWEMICLDYKLQGFFPEPKHTHCYNGHGVVQKQWLHLIESVHQPMSFYRYKGNGITYIWKSYTGNV